MSEALARLSPWLSTRPVPLAGRLIGAIGPVVFLLLLAQTFLRPG